MSKGMVVFLAFILIMPVGMLENRKNDFKVAEENLNTSFNFIDKKDTGDNYFPWVKNADILENWTINIFCYDFRLTGDIMGIFPYNAGLWILVLIFNALFPGFPLFSGIPLLLIMILGAIYKPTTIGLWIVDQSRGNPTLYAKGLLGETEIEKKNGILLVITIGFTGVITPAWEPNVVGSTLFLAAK